MTPRFLKSAASLAVLAALAFANPAFADDKKERDLSAEGGSDSLSASYDETSGYRRGMKLQIKSLNGNTVEAGDYVRFQLKSNRDGFVHLYVVSASGRVQLWMENVEISAGETINYPSSKDVKIKAEPPYGKDRIVAILTERRLDGFRGRVTTLRPVDLDMSEAAFRREVEGLMSDVPKSRWTWAGLTIKLAR